MFDVNSFNFDTPLDVIVCMNDEFMQRNFAINLVEVNHKIHERTEGKVTGILLEKNAKKYYNIDIDIVIKALLITFKEELKDENKLAKIALMFMQDSSSKFKNLRLLIDFFSYIDLCPNTDSTYLYLPGFYYQELKDEYLVLNSIGFDSKMIIELIMDREILKDLNRIANMNDNKISLIAYGNRLKASIAKKGIDENDVPKVSSYIAKID